MIESEQRPLGGPKVKRHLREVRRAHPALTRFLAARCLRCVAPDAATKANLFSQDAAGADRDFQLPDLDLELTLVGGVSRGGCHIGVPVDLLAALGRRVLVRVHRSGPLELTVPLTYPPASRNPYHYSTCFVNRAFPA